MIKTTAAILFISAILLSPVFAEPYNRDNDAGIGVQIGPLGGSIGVRDRDYDRDYRPSNYYERDEGWRHRHKKMCLDHEGMRVSCP